MSDFISFPDKNYDHFLPLSENETRWGLYLTAAGWDILRPGDSCKLEGRPHIYRIQWDKGRVLHEYLLLYSQQGSASFRSDTTSDRTIPTGAFVLLHPGIWHTYKPNQETGWTNIWITLNGTLLHEYSRIGIFSPQKPILILPEERRKQAAEIFWNLVQQVREKESSNNARYSGTLLSLLTTLYSPEKKPVPNGDTPEDTVQRARDFIWNWGYRKLCVASIAAHVGKTRRTLERYFEEILGCTIIEEINHCRITRATSILQQTRIKISHVATMAGFTGTCQMNRAFQNYLGKTPGEIRNNG